MHKQSNSFMNTGFTIVELLVVIVVIGILASITIVSYNGVTSRANNTSSQAAAGTVAQKAEVYNSETGTFPTASSDLTTDTSKSYYVSATSITFVTTLTAVPSNPNTVRLVKCGVAPYATQSDITTVNIRGLRIYYWTYTGTPNGNNYMLAGSDAGAEIACP